MDPITWLNMLRRFLVIAVAEFSITAVAYSGFDIEPPRFYISLLSALESVGMKVCEQVENICLFAGIFRFPESR